MTSYKDKVDAERYNPSWTTMEGQLGMIVSKMKREGYEPTLIVGVTRGGLIPAVRLSHKLSVPMVTVSYSSKEGKGDDKNHDNVIGDIKGEKLLIVDDISDSGNTLAELTQLLSSGNEEVKTVALYNKESSVHQPTYFACGIPDDAPFITFPWEA
jgi:hypoxanthine phosphoribosyltransferase